MTRWATLVIARLTFKEAVRRKIVLGALLMGLAFLATFGLGVYFIRWQAVRDGVEQNVVIRNQMYNFLQLSGLYVVNFLFAAIAVLSSVDTIAGEIASGTIHAVAAKPLRRWEIVLGKWLGLTCLLTLYLALMAGGVYAVGAAVTRYRLPHFARALALMWLNGMLMLSVSLLGGTQLSALANGVVAFALYGLAFIGGWVEQIGSFLNSQAAVNVGIVSSLLMPSEALWRRAAYEMRSLVVDAVGFSPFTSGTSVPSALMIAYAACYAVAALGLAVWRFQRRDL